MRAIIIASIGASRRQLEHLFANSSPMPMTRTTISFTRDGMQLIQEAVRRQGASVSQFVREAALNARVDGCR